MANQNMKEFVGKSRAATQEGASILYFTNYEVSSWLHDAASLLDIIEHDEGILALMEEYYNNPHKLPWNIRSKND
jgi:hypothetical protein